MNTAAYALYTAGYVLQVLLLWRVVRLRAWRHYPLFCTYFVYTCCSGSVQLALALLRYSAYVRVYYSTEAVAAILRFAVAWEIYRQVFRRGSTVRNIAGGALGGVLALLALVFWLSVASVGNSAMVDFMRKMALAVAVWMLVVLGLARLYRIPAGRNISGMAIGFVIFAGSEMVDFASFDLAPRLGIIWRYVHPFGYLFMLAVWLWGLWEYAPNPQLVNAEEATRAQGISWWREQSASLEAAIRKVTKP